MTTIVRYLQLTCLGLCLFLSTSTNNMDPHPLESGSRSNTVTLYNDRPRYDIYNQYVDAHDGMILYQNGLYYLYGEYYNETTGQSFPWPNAPILSVYTSVDLVSWTFRGNVLPPNATGVASTQWIPNVFYDTKTSRFIMWFGSGDWCSATSYDGISFNLAVAHFTSRLSGGTDGTGTFIDDDENKTGYVIFAALSNNPGMTGHLVSIERMTDDYLSSTKVNVSGFFPDGYVESPALFKRNGIYYATYGSCCCACRGGGGIVVFTSSSIYGPWTRQSPYADVNCLVSNATICGGFGARTTDRADLVYNAQWWGVSLIPTLVNNIPTTTYLFTGRRWLSGINNPSGCDDMCGNNGNPSACTASNYYLRSDLDVWYPFEFDDTNNGIIKPLHNLPNFTLTLTNTTVGYY